MPFKVVLLFNGATIPAGPVPNLGLRRNTHPYGFSESYLTSTNNFDNEVTFLRTTLAPRRAALLPRQTSIIGARFYQPGGGRAILVNLTNTGTSQDTDLVSCAVLCSSNNSAAAVQRKWWIHNVPDDYLVGGEFVPSEAYRSRFMLYMQAIGQASWSGIVRQNQSPIFTIDQSGLVTLTVVNPFSVGQFVQVSRTLSSDKRRIGGKFRILSLGPLATQFTLYGWTLGATTGGQAFVPSRTLYVIGATGLPFPERSGTRRVGRPFDLYRGRSSRKRVNA